MGGDARMGLIDRLKAAWTAFREDKEPLNGGHRYGIVIGDSCYMADAYRISEYDGQPVWYYSGADGNIKGRKMDGWILKDFRPDETLDEFRSRP